MCQDYKTIYKADSLPKVETRYVCETLHPRQQQSTKSFIFSIIDQVKVKSKGETITRVNGDVSFFAGKRLQNF